MKEEASLLAQVREKLQGLKGPQFWKSLDELADNEEFRTYLKEEYPYGAAEFDKPVDRRDFLKLMGASLLLSGLAGCKPQPLEKIVPYVKAVEDIVPGKPLFYATSYLFNGSAIGLLVESHLGRPTKVEGNPEHPESLGATNLFAQASVLSLYDPDRSKAVLNAGRVSTWSRFVTQLAEDLESQKAAQGTGVRVLSGPLTSPTLLAQAKEFLALYPKAKWVEYDPVFRDYERAGSELAFGEVVDPVYSFDKADIVVSLDADFLFSLPGSICYAKQFISRRSLPGDGMNRLYALESTPTLTGAAADHVMRSSASDVLRFAAALAGKTGVTIPSDNTPLTPKETEWLNAVAKDLNANRGKCLVVAGRDQTPAVHALAHAMNKALGNAGTTVKYISPVEERASRHIQALKELSAELASGKVELLITLDVNPVYNAPADLEFEKHYLKAPRRVHYGLFVDETALMAHWHVPGTHYLEHFSDARAFDGTASMVQPLIKPLYAGKSPHEFASALLGKKDESGEDIVINYWKKIWGESDFTTKWRRALHAGFVQGTVSAPKNVSAKSGFNPQEIAYPAAAQGLELIIRPDPSVWDGSFANNSWLQELPKFLTTLTWDNAAIISPKLAEKEGLKQDDVVELKAGAGVVEASIYVLPGQPDESVTVHLGYGRTAGGELAKDRGFNAYRLRTSKEPSFLSGLRLRKTGKTNRLASTQNHHSMENRDLIRKGTLEEYSKDPEFAVVEHHTPYKGDPSMYPQYPYEGYAWGMVINLNACIGCNACVVACQSENNVPTVGKKEVLNSREMHWIRIDRYFSGDLDNPEKDHQPVLCMHCEKAPCEPVCPVGATTHSDEGLNEMTYNRCVGTKYCSNNCPYKVRRFNFFEYADKNVETLKMQRNPDVTVRARGVMEKCTFCVQRINSARIEAKKADRRIKDGDVVTACQSACPTQAIVFGDINDPESAVAKLKKLPLNYGLLTELNTVPRVSYLAKVKNPNPELVPNTGVPSHGH